MSFFLLLFLLPSWAWAQAVQTPPHLKESSTSGEDMTRHAEGI